MRLKSFYGPTMTEAMRLVRETLGEDAIIVATRDDENGGVRVTAAIDDVSTKSHNQSLSKVTQETDSESIDVIAESLIKHQVPNAIGERLLATATQYASEDCILAIGAAFDTHFKFEPLPEDFSLGPIILIGPPGAGKTLCAAKIATKATMAKKKVALISTDTERAGGMAQLAAFASLLKIDLLEIEDAPALHDAVAIQDHEALVIIDTAGCNPFNENDKATLAAVIKASSAKPILVLPADLDSSDAIDLAKEFGLMGARTMLSTRLDMTKRLGGLLRTAFETRMTLCNFSASAKVTEALQPLNPVSLARLILPKSQVVAPKATGTHS